VYKVLKVRKEIKESLDSLETPVLKATVETKERKAKVSSSPRCTTPRRPE
jgi:hypothetical protein